MKNAIVKIGKEDLAKFGEWYSAAIESVRKAHRVDQVKAIHDKAEAFRVYSKLAKNTELANRAVRIKMRAKLKGGQLLKEMKAKRERQGRGGDRKSKPHEAALIQPKLSELGITTQDASNWQMLADACSGDNPEAALDQLCEEIEQETVELTSKVVERALIQAPARAAKQQKIADEAKAGGQAMPTGTLFPVVMCDCPWEYDFSETESRAINNQYPPLSVEKLCAGIFDEPDGSRRDVRSLFAKDAVMFFWATAPKLREALEVLKAWGFEYVTNLVWDKEKIGMGYWARGQHELLFVGTQGNKIPVPLPEDRVSSVIREARTDHSKKPIAAYEIIEKYFPDLPKLELFCRAGREGWVSWGNQLN